MNKILLCIFLLTSHTLSAYDAEYYEGEALFLTGAKTAMTSACFLNVFVPGAQVENPLEFGVQNYALMLKHPFKVLAIMSGLQGLSEAKRGICLMGKASYNKHCEPEEPKWEQISFTKKLLHLFSCCSRKRKES